MGSFAKGEIVLFPFPYTDLSNRKLRPCLVLSDEMADDLLLCQITSKQTKPDDFAIELVASEVLDGELVIDSFIRANMLFTADKSQIQMKLCRISDKKYRELVSVILKLISK